MADFDWVRARAECSLRKVFFRLAAGVRSDVDARNEVARTNSDNELFEASNEGERVLITRTERSDVRRIEFSLGGDAITVEGDGINFKATPGLNNTGDCTLMVDGDELQLWQVRRKALEKLFFDEKPIVRIAAQRKPS